MTMQETRPAAAWIILWTAAVSRSPCSMSRKSQSKPVCAAISAISGEGSDSRVPSGDRFLGPDRNFRVMEASIIGMSHIIIRDRPA